MSEPSHPFATSNLRKTSLIQDDSAEENSLPPKIEPIASVGIEYKRRRKRQDPQVCPSTIIEDFVVNEDSLMSSSDVETFQGEIVYNLDANSAYIIDNGEDECFLPLTEDRQSGQTTGCRTTKKQKFYSASEKSENSLTKSKDSSRNSKSLIADPDISSILSRAPTPKQTSAATNPKIHSFRVVSAHDAITSTSKCKSDETSISKKIQKPILMCFICKFSFGNTKSFSLHASTEHSLNLQDLELESSLLKREFSSAIIQRNMDEKPQISFLEPLNEEDQKDDHKRLEAERIMAANVNEKDFQRQASSHSISTFDCVNVTSLSDLEQQQQTGEADLTTSRCNIETSDETDTKPSRSPSSISATATSSSVTLEKEAFLLKTIDMNKPEIEQISNSPKSCMSPKEAQREIELNAEAYSEKIDANSTDNLSSNNTDNVDEVSEKTYKLADVSRKIQELPFSAGSSSPTTAVGSISAAVADFLQQQLQHLSSPLRHIQASSPPSTASSMVTTSTTIADSSSLSLALLSATGSTSVPHEKNPDSLNSSISSSASDQNPNSVQFLHEFLLQHHLAMQQQVPQHLTCPDHSELDGIDCKTCEVHKQLKCIKQQIAPQISTSTPTTGISGSSNISAQSNVCSTVSSSLSATNSVSNAPTVSVAPSFTIGACSEHINGRPLGVDCVRCEMILTSARLNSGVQISSTRNSCKTLKCPQCNWHYKYQETLEIHMREKHPDGESACGYCLAGQQHPRLARGESYSCGYKPYRCEICNYSTTTKGNLSIHMQSDKHLNNMQELNNSQNMVAAAAAAAAVAAAAGSSGSKIISEGNNTGSLSKALMQSSSSGNGTSQNLQQTMPANSTSGTAGTSANSVNSNISNKPRPSFRCDICSYETSVARNLRIHMTSEKHTHNMAVLQNNIKHIQAFSFLQQQHQQATAAVAAAAAVAANSNISPQVQGGVSVLGSNLANTGTGTSMNSGENSPFLPEVALADMAYNQALMIQLLQQNVAAAAAAQQQQQQQQQQQLACKSPIKISQLSPNSQSSQTQQQRCSPVDKSPTRMVSDINGTELCFTSPMTDAFSEPDMSPYGKPDPFPRTLYSCLVCSVFNTNSLDELQQHLMTDRSRNSNSSHDIMILHNNNYICRLCNYKTNLKANFQLHSKTDKHLQKLNFINHIREGGPRNEYKLKFQQQQQFAANTVQLKCNCCDFYTNSIQKLSLHVQHMRHETMRAVFHHLRYLLIKQGNDNGSIDNSMPISSLSQSMSSLSADIAATGNLSSDMASDCLEKQLPTTGCARVKVLFCQLCNYAATNLLDMVRHVKSLRHLQVEQFICLQRRSENLDGPSLDDIFKLNEQEKHETSAFSGEAQLESNDDESFKPKPNTSSSSSSIFSGKSTTHPPMSSVLVEDVINASVSGEVTTEVDSPMSFYSSMNTSYRKPEQIMDSAENMPNTIYKCNISTCEFLAQTKIDLESHHEEAHQGSELDFVSIPTNAAAIQAFQAAVAAATAAAAAAASCFTGKNVFSVQEDDDCPVAIKKERLDFHQKETNERHMKELETNIRQQIQDVATKDQSQNTSTSKNNEEDDSKIQCPLCQDAFVEKQTLEIHLMKVHSVSQDGLMRLLQLVSKSDWQGSSDSTSSGLETSRGEPANDMKIPSASTDVKEVFFCQQCRSGFESEHLLLQHAQKSQHFTIQENGEYICFASDINPRSCNLSFANQSAMLAHYRNMHVRSNDGPSCSSNLVISERHVYKYRCKQCSLAFKTEAKLNTHALYHTMRDATKCNQCQRNFRSTQALQKHLEQAHINKPHSVATNPLDLPVIDGSKEVGSTGSSTDVSEASQKSASPMLQVLQSGKLLSPAEIERNVIPLNQQHQVAAITAALLKQQQQYTSSESNDRSPPLPTSSLDSLQTPQVENIFKQDAEQQRLATISSFQSLQNLQSFQGLQSLQQMQHHIPQLAAAASSNLHINPVDMLNLMQFHHLMSLNFMNLAPPLIFGGNTTTATTTGSSSNAAPSESLSITTSSEHSQHIPNIAPTTPATGITSQESPSQLLQHQQKQQASPGMVGVQLSTNQKRARTRITDEQLKILRAHFDINNSPSEESILEMSEKANLPMKVVKHWFRNTLFKERQRNKDSPYNFNNPPSTTLNLEEYERTGQAKVTPLNEVNVTLTAPSVENKGISIITETRGCSPTTNTENFCNMMSSQSTSFTSSNENKPTTKTKDCSPEDAASDPGNFLNVVIKTEPSDEAISSCTSVLDPEKGFHHPHQEKHLIASSTALAMLKKHQQRLSDILTEHDRESEQSQQVHEQLHHQNRPQVGTSPAALSQMQSAVQQAYYNSYDAKSESGSSDILSRPPTPNSATAINMHPYSNINDLLSQQLEHMPSSNTSGTSQMGPPKNFQLTGSGGNNSKVNCGGTTFEKNSPSQFDTNSNSSTGSSTSSGKRANRTRFTDYQIKVLQEFFENNSYPKDSDLEYLSKLLLLSPRVIVVWFQNARQKQRKIYENQPNNSLYESEEKKQNINYACKKCNLVFQRYYELIRHQKNHCFKEENNKKSAKAQIAAAQIAQNLSSEDSNSSMDIGQQHHQHHVTAAAVAAMASTAAAATVGSGSGSSIASSIMSNNGFNLIPTSPQYPAFNKSALVDTFSPSTTPTPPSQQRERSNSIEQRHLQSSPIKNKHECDKCKLTFSHLEHLREHQLLHIVSPGIFTIGSPVQNQNSQSQLPMDNPTTVYGPFGSILQNLQQVVQQQQVGKKRKYSETSSNADDQSSIGCISSSTGDYDIQTKRYEFLYQYFMQNESSNELKQQFQNQRLASSHDNEADTEFLTSYYHQCELKRRSSYEFLFQYYIKNEHPHLPAMTLEGESKPTFDFLLQYYQIHESKKFFQLDASPQPTLDPDEAIPRCRKQPKYEENRVFKNSEEPVHNGASNENTADNVYSFFKINDNFSNVSDNSSTPFNRCQREVGDSVKHGVSRTNSAGSEENDINRDQLSKDEKLEILEKLKTDNQQQVSSNIKSTSEPRIITNENNLQYQNLEDMSDATMIENNSQPITTNEVTPLSQTYTQTHIETDDKNQITGTGKPSNCCESKQNKRLRTTILPDQLNFLYECYQNESNPSRKMLEEIAKKVNLKKRVVQVWFQNARAKDKKSRNQRYMPQISDDSNTNSILKVTQVTKEASESKVIDYKICQLSDLNAQPCNLTVGQVRHMKDLVLLNENRNLPSIIVGGDKIDSDVATKDSEANEPNGDDMKQNEATRFHCIRGEKNTEKLLKMEALKDLVVQHKDRKDFFASSLKKSNEIVDSRSNETEKTSTCINNDDFKQCNQNVLINFNSDSIGVENDEDDIRRDIRHGGETRNHSGNDIIKQMFKFNQITGKLRNREICVLIN